MGVSVAGREWQVLRCRVCGKDFYVPCIGEWVYKDRRGKLLCSYKCMRTLEGKPLSWEQVAAEKQGKAYKPPDSWYEVARLKDEGKSWEEIAQIVGRSVSGVRNMLSRLRFFERYGIEPYRG